jgi:hypothetical protein
MRRTDSSSCALRLGVGSATKRASRSPSFFGFFFFFLFFFFLFFFFSFFFFSFFFFKRKGRFLFYAPQTKIFSGRTLPQKKPGTGNFRFGGGGVGLLVAPTNATKAPLSGDACAACASVSSEGSAFPAALLLESRARQSSTFFQILNAVRTAALARPKIDLLWP